MSNKIYNILFHTFYDGRGVDRRCRLEYLNLKSLYSETVPIQTEEIIKIVYYKTIKIYLNNIINKKQI